MMSRPITRIALFVLVSFVLVAATSASVRGWLGGSSDVSGAQAHLVSGVQTNFNHDRSSVSELESLQMQGGSETFKQSGSGHGCESESHPVPLD